MKKVAASVLLVLCASLSAGLIVKPAHAEAILIAANESRPPKVFKDQQGMAQGILVEIMRYIQDEMGQQFNLELYPWSRALKMASNGEAGIIGLSVNKERLVIFDYPAQPLFHDELVLVTRAGKEFPFSTVADLKGKLIGVCRNCSHGDAYDQAVRDKIFEPVPGDSASAQLAMLLHDRIDAVLVTVGRAGFEEALRGKVAGVDLAQHRDKFVILPVPFARDPNYLAFAKSMDKKKFLAQVDVVLKKGHESGAIQKIIDRYIASRQ
ncbi:substrate-binding periplasmic protein [Noviherbaspirillum galbum]|uniref:Amino acid ABC transporter substrate-binding protein n=1 Tax=Noviherbaspirillum galbum TaxID=2709383 RepID=A0A6B3SPX2_9BURK|nr:transporter substrate-binding domain-containing protein [Noviherbaspirillum galbum]NEX62950.1 amino acid ABC transporter substrate-binding protein [Noviherbaspirillum galbum]